MGNGRARGQGRSLRREFSCQDEADSSTPILFEGSGLHLGRQVALQLLTPFDNRQTGLRFRYQRNFPPSSWQENSNPERSKASGPLGGGT